MSMLQFAEQLAAEGDLVGAIGEYDAAIGLRERVLGRDHPLTAMVISARARVHAKLGNTRAAIGDYERILASSIATGMDVNVLAHVRFELAQLLPVGSRTRARGLAEEARRILAGNKQLFGDDVVEIDAWLGSHPPAP
jgi:tetratricopeptide (TPR) repeat protein